MGKNHFRTAEKRMLQCNFCSAAFRKLQRIFGFRLWHVARVGFRGVGFRTSPSLLRDDQNLRNDRLTVQWRRAGGFGCRIIFSTEGPFGQGPCHVGSGLENNSFPRKVGLRWVFVNRLKWVQKWVLGAQVGQKRVETHFSPTLNPFRDFRETPLFTQFKGGGKCFLKRA